MISHNVYNDLIFQAIGGIDPKFDELIQTINYSDGVFNLTATHNGELVDILTSLPEFIERTSNPRIWEDTFTFKVSNDWQIVLDSFITQQHNNFDQIIEQRAKDYASMLNDIYI